MAAAEWMVRAPPTATAQVRALRPPRDDDPTWRSPLTGGGGGTAGSRCGYWRWRRRRHRGRGRRFGRRRGGRAPIDGGCAPINIDGEPAHACPLHQVDDVHHLAVGD